MIDKGVSQRKGTDIMSIKQFLKDNVELQQ